MKMIMIVTLLCLSTTKLLAETKIIDLLSNKRADIKFAPLASDERQAIIDHARLLFSKLYVNFEHKTAMYEKFRPMQDLSIIEQNKNDMSDDEFHTSMIKIFNSTHDYHTNYNLPVPYACYVAFLPFNMRKTGTKKILISTTNPKVINIFPEITKITPGDELISYNKMTPQQFIESRKDIVATPTVDAALMQGMFDMYYRNLGGSLVPDRDAVNLVFKKASGSFMKIKVPWMVQYNDSCINPQTQKNAGKAEGKKASRLAADSDIQMFKERRQFFKEMRKNFLSFFNKKKSFIADPAVETVDLSNASSTLHPDLSYKNIPWKGQNIGWLQLTSFDAPKGVKAAVDEVRKVVSQKLNNTSAIVVDLRGNYGGQIVFAEEMAALFNPRPVKVLPFFMRANDITLALYNSDMSWRDLILPQSTTNSIVGPGTVTTESELLSVSQEYFGKVVLLTNSECFSSCDLFSAAMKDNNKAIIYGVDHSTMGGGANVWPMEAILDAFTAAHLPTKLPQGISTRITGRHAHRLSSGKLIEDAGVETDKLLFETDADIIDPDHSSIMAKIFNDLVESPGHASSEISLGLEGDEKIIRHGNSPFSLIARPKVVDQIAIFKNNKFVKRAKLDQNNTMKFSLETPAGKFGQDSFIIYGFSKETATKFPILRKSILTESLGDYVSIDQVDAIANAVMINSQQVDLCNWIKKENSLVLVGPYCADGKLEAIESLNVSNGTHILSFDLNLDAEPTFDFFDIRVETENGFILTLMAPVSDPKTGHFEYDLSQLAGQKIDIRFRMTADEASSGNGVTISNLKIK
ncbi:MAG: hypothetical protein H7177_11910 [Rhizobacter sp.]|nr:hypothetical protein [Bacteriovorax sp.]